MTCVRWSRRLRFSLPDLHLGRLAFIPFALVTFLFLFSLFSPFALIAPAYALPARLPANAAVPNQTHITFDDQAELVGYELPAKSVSPGGQLPLTLYWRARTRMTEDYSVYIRLFDVTGKIVGRWDAFPGRGLYRRGCGSPAKSWSTSIACRWQ